MLYFIFNSEIEENEGRKQAGEDFLGRLFPERAATKERVSSLGDLRRGAKE